MDGIAINYMVIRTKCTDEMWVSGGNGRVTKYLMKWLKRSNN